MRVGAARVFLSIGALLFSGACDERGSDAPLVSGLVRAAEGGTLVVPPPHELAGSSIVIPAGALDADTTVAILEASARAPHAVGPTLAFEPAGTQLSSPATLTLVYEPDELPDPELERELVVAEISGGQARALHPGTIDADRHVIRAEVRTLSRYAVTVGLFPGLRPYCAQLHVHGHSNHNGSAQPGSMQWHSAWAQHSGTDVLWWTEHVEMFDLRSSDERCDVFLGSLEPQTLDVVGLGTGIARVTRLEARVSGGNPVATLHPDGLAMTLHSDPKAESWQWFEYEAESDAGTLRGLRWPRPVASGAVLELELRAFPGDPDTRTEIAVDLSWHLDDEEVQQQVVYRLVPDWEPFRQELVDANHVLVSIPTPRERSLHVLDLLSAASGLRDGSDNTIHAITFRVGARHGSEAVLFLRSFGIHSTAPGPENQLGTVLLHAGRYELEYGVSQHVGAENGNFLRPELPHVNAFLPDDLADVRLLRRPEDALDLAGWVEEVHARGGLVSLNHVFGTSSGFSTLLPPEERAARSRSVSEEMLRTRAHGADLLEVGYLARGGADLRDHLDAWDRTLASGMHLVGIGVSDTHGGAWHATMPPGSFTTWVLARSTGSAELIEGLRRGRAFFGNGFLWDGTFAFRVGTAQMGERALARAERERLVLQFDPWPADVDLYLVQGLIRPGLEVEYLHALTRIERDAELALDTHRSSFVRLEAWRRTGPSAAHFPLGEPIAFTNPVVLLRE